MVQAPQRGERKRNQTAGYRDQVVVRIWPSVRLKAEFICDLLPSAFLAAFEHHMLLFLYKN